MSVTDYGFEWPVDGDKSNVKVERMALLPGNYGCPESCRAGGG